MLVENAMEEGCAEILEETYDKYETEILNLLRERAERLKQLMEKEIRELRKLNAKLTRDHEEIQGQLQANDLYTSYWILQLKQQLSQM